jgi:hypothetical protein
MRGAARPVLGRPRRRPAWRSPDAPWPPLGPTLRTSGPDARLPADSAALTLALVSQPPARQFSAGLGAPWPPVSSGSFSGAWWAWQRRRTRRTDSENDAVASCTPRRLGCQSTPMAGACRRFLPGSGRSGRQDGPGGDVDQSMGGSDVSVRPISVRGGLMFRGVCPQGAIGPPATGRGRVPAIAAAPRARSASAVISR